MAGFISELYLYEEFAGTDLACRGCKDVISTATPSLRSKPIESRTALDAQFASDLDKFANTEPPRPDYWGGYIINPTKIEFWKGRTSRMHDRLEFIKAVNDQGVDTWVVQRLQP